jgi:exodeoxyribonuclease VII large subunit
MQGRSIRLTYSPWSTGATVAQTRTGFRMNEPRVNIVEWTISELSAVLRRTVEDAFGFVRVRGEVSGFRGAHSSGHCYFALKDEGAKIEAVVWKTSYARMKFKPQEGLEVIATGRLTTFPGQSKYQIVIETLEPAGIGALMALLEERKRKLTAEGLFEAARKQLLPFLPGVIGVVTSPTGAVIRDILHRLADRFPRHVLVWPVRVQGDGSAAEVAAAITGFNALPEHGPIPRPDLLIVARGGGSLEDLWSFNEEIVVRAAADSMIPLISAVGHETDVTLIDFASDKRAPTPTAAAEMAVPVRADLLVEIDSLARRTRACWQRGQESRRTELRAAMRALPGADELLALPRQRLDHAAARLPRALTANAQIHHTAYSRVAGRLTPQTLKNRIGRESTQAHALMERLQRCLRVHVERRRDRYDALALRLGAARAAYVDACHTRIGRAQERVGALHDRATRAVTVLVRNRTARLERAERLLTAVSYRGVLARGFALVRDRDGSPLRTAAAIDPGVHLDIEFADGRVGARADAASGSVNERDPVVQATPPKPPSKPRRAGRGADNADQGSLFGT